MLQNVEKIIIFVGGGGGSNQNPIPDILPKIAKYQDSQCQFRIPTHLESQGKPENVFYFSKKSGKVKKPFYPY